MMYPDSKISELLTYIQRRHRLLIAPHTMAEVPNVLHRKSPQSLRLWRRFLADGVYIVLPEPSPRMLARAPKTADLGDVPILAAAVANRIDRLITGDTRHFFTDAVRERLPVVTPSEARRILRLD